MSIQELKKKAVSLPYLPGVYIMRDKEDTVIYVGKAKKLKNRVSQYFQDTASHTPKTLRMVAAVDHFDVIVAASEFEALVLECSLIKRYMPKYNILLKDDKGYPYIRLDIKKPYPVPTLASRIEDDSAEYFGPFGSRGITQQLIETILHVLKLPSCGRHFPRDIGKGRPCLNYAMKQCEGWCRAEADQSAYAKRIEQARQLLMGNYKDVAASLRQEMLEASEKLNFELAAGLRDRMNAVSALGQKQFVTAGSSTDTDAVGFAQTEAKACFTVLHFHDGNLVDKEYMLLSPVDEIDAAVSSLLKQYYLSRGFAPKEILVPFEMEDCTLFSELLRQKFGKAVKIRMPKRGEGVRLTELASQNAEQEAIRITTKEEKLSGTLVLLSKALSIPIPKRIESFDISNISGTDIVAGMVVFQDGKPHKSEYRHFKLENMHGQDDYGAMRQVVRRRFEHFLQGDKGFDRKPDLLLIDGGTVHAQTALSVLSEMGISVPVFGMVKDDKHRTRALVTPDGREIRIDHNPSVFSFIGNIQEETHRFAISFHKSLRSKRLHYSELDSIPHIGQKRKQELLKSFHSLAAISDASLLELERFLPKNAAKEVYQHFHPEQKEDP